MSAPANETRRKQKRKKPGESISSLIKETPAAAAADLLRKNEPFALPDGKSWVMLFVTSASLGGMNSTQTENKDKGQIAQLIASDMIQTVATSEMLADEAFGIIPSEKVLEEASQFGLLLEGKYHWAVVSQPASDSLSVRVLGAETFSRPQGDDEEGLSEEELQEAEELSEATLRKANAVAKGRSALHEVFGPHAWLSLTGQSAEDAVSQALIGEDSEPETQSVAVVDGFGDDFPGDGFADGFGDGADAGTAQQGVQDEGEAPAFGGEGFDPAVASAAAGEGVELGDDFAGEAFDDDYPIAQGGPVDFDPSDEADGDALDFDDDGDFDPYGEHGQRAFDAPAGAYQQQIAPAVPQGTYVEEVGEAMSMLARRFLGEKLNLDIRLEEFNTTFAVGVPLVETLLPDNASEWLADQVAQLTRQANGEVARLHQTNQDRLRSMYVDLMGQHAERVLQQVTVDDPSSQFGKAKAAIDGVYQEQLKGKEAQVLSVRKEIEDRYAKDAQDRADAAARTAKAQYIERNRARKEREQQNATVDVERAMEEAHDYAMQDMLQRRRDLSVTLMERGQTKVFQVLREMQEAGFEQVRETNARLRAEIIEFIDNHRKSDISRVEALHEHHSRVNEIEDLKAKHAEALSDQDEANRDHVRRLEEEFERARQRSLQEQEKQESDWQHKLQLVKVDLENEARANQKLSAQIASLGETYAKQYEDRLNEEREKALSFSKELENSNLVQSRSSKLMALLMVTLGLVGLAVGFILGVAF